MCTVVAPRPSIEPFCLQILDPDATDSLFVRYADRTFVSAGDRERVRSVLADLSKTGGDFRALTNKALDAVADAILPRLRPVLEEVGTVSSRALNCSWLVI